MSLFPAKSLRSRTSSVVSGSSSLSALCGENPLPTASTTFNALKGSPSSIEVLFTVNLSALAVDLQRDVTRLLEVLLRLALLADDGRHPVEGHPYRLLEAHGIIDSTISSGAFS